MDFRRIEQFVAVAQQGSFGRAAQALLMSQPALTQGIKALEEDVGVTLFQRGPKGAKLTQAGSKFLPRAQSIILDFREAMTELEPSRALETDHIRIGVSPNFLHEVVPGFISRRIETHPAVNIALYKKTD